MNLNTHPIPESISRRITEHGGLSPNGLPLFRVIWGGDRLTFMGGKWKKYDDSGNEIGETVEERLVTKYGQFEKRWIMEMWCPPENYGDEERWERDTTAYFDGQKVYQLGPFPRQGEYELLMPLETPEHPNPRKSRQFVPLTSSVCEALIAVAVRNKHLPREIRIEHAREMYKKSQEKSAQKRADRLSEFTRPFHGRDHIIVPGEVTKDGRIIL